MRSGGGGGGVYLTKDRDGLAIREAFFLQRDDLMNEKMVLKHDQALSFRATRPHGSRL